MLRCHVIVALVFAAAAPATRGAGDDPLTVAGLLHVNGAPYTGVVDLRFRVFDDPVAGAAVSMTWTLTDQPVTGGLYHAHLDPAPASPYGGLWLEVSVDLPGEPIAWEALEPRIALTPQAGAATTCLGRSTLDSPDGALVGVVTVMDSGDVLIGHRPDLGRTGMTIGERGIGINGLPAALGLSILTLPDAEDMNTLRVTIPSGSTSYAALRAAHVQGSDGIGLRATSGATSGDGVGLLATSPGIGASATVSSGLDTRAALGETFGASGAGVYGRALAPSRGASSATGVRGESSTGYAVFSLGNLGAVGLKTFRIDHPATPADAYIQHFSIEAPTPLNVYSGNVDTDHDGRAVVRLPDYFPHINRDLTFQLTPIGAPATPWIEHISPRGDVTIAGGPTNGQVSWRITAERADDWARNHPPRAVVAKSGAERGHFLSPELHQPHNGDRP